MLSNLDTKVSEEVAQGVAALGASASLPAKDRAASTFVPDSRWGATTWARRAIHEEMEAYGDNEFVEWDDFGLFEGATVSFQPELDGGLLLLFDSQAIGKRVP